MKLPPLPTCNYGRDTFGYSANSSNTLPQAPLQSWPKWKCDCALFSWEKPPRAHAVWVAPRYTHRHDGYVYTEGRWR